jgi:hypothetical protein
VDPLQTDIDKAARRAAHYWVEDGLQETLVGAFLLLIGLFLVLEGLLPRRSPFHAAFALGFPVVLIGVGVLVRRLVVTLKDRYVHPRTGYVSFQRHSRQAGWVGGVVGGLVAFIIVLLSRAPGLLSWIPALQGLLLAAAFLYAGRKVQLLRFPVQALLVALAGLGLALLGLDENVAAGLLFVWTGAAMATGGLLAFRAYLRQAPPGERA